MNPIKQPFLAEFELYVMLAVARLGEKCYGAAIRREIEERTARPVSIGAVYATTARLEDKGFLAHRISDPLPIKGGRSRKYYTLTKSGTDAVRHSAQMLNRMMTGLDIIAESH